MILLDGKQVAKAIKDRVKTQTQTYKNNSIQPGLAVVLVGNDPASEVYVGHKIKTCKELGIESFLHRLNANDEPQKLYDLISQLNKNPSVHGILVQMPLPKNFSENKVLDLIDPKKDVDGLTPENVGLAWSGRARVYPCTPSGIIEILNFYKISIERKNVVVVGRSEIVGKPMAQMFLEKNATVTICHSKTKSLEEFTKAADIVVVAVGKRNFFGQDFFTSDSVVIDVGMHRLEEGLLCGDVFFKDVEDKVRAITPVPGGVGPMTIAMLMQNTLKLYDQQLNGQKGGK
jgi:methylenetetrahydrofolate dehydrogenase (NADP+)/methenyltetrahydrofolate cyclohydrolase